MAHSLDVGDPRHESSQDEEALLVLDAKLPLLSDIRAQFIVEVFPHLLEGKLINQLDHLIPLLVKMGDPVLITY